MPILESAFEAKFMQACKRLMIKCRKLKLEGEGSWPDRTLTYRGAVCFVELKSDGETPTPLQLYTLSELRKEGFEARWFDNFADAEAFIINWKIHVDSTHIK